MSENVVDNTMKGYDGPFLLPEVSDLADAFAQHLVRIDVLRDLCRNVPGFVLESSVGHPDDCNVGTRWWGQFAFRCDTGGLILLAFPWKNPIGSPELPNTVAVYTKKNPVHERIGELTRALADLIRCHCSEARPLHVRHGLSNLRSDP